MTAQGPNPRFLVTNLPAEGFATAVDKTRFAPARRSEEFYCPRGEMENVLKQPGLDWQAGTDWAQATAGSVRRKLLKVAGQVRVRVRRVYVQLSSASCRGHPPAVDANPFLAGKVRRRRCQQK